MRLSSTTFVTVATILGIILELHYPFEVKSVYLQF